MADDERSYATLTERPSWQKGYSPYGMHNPYIRALSRRFGAVAPVGIEHGATREEVRAKTGFAGLGSLGDIGTLYSTYKPWIWIAGAIAGLLWAKKAGYIEG